MGSHYDCDSRTTTADMEWRHFQKEIHFPSMFLIIIHRKNFEKKTHNQNAESDSVVLCVDYALNGIVLWCGPVVLDQYRFNDVLFRFQFTFWFMCKGIIKFW